MLHHSTGRFNFQSCKYCYWKYEMHHRRPVCSPTRYSIAHAKVSYHPLGKRKAHHTLHNSHRALHDSV